MPRRADLHSILLIGSGPIVIGQACEFDYSGTQGAKALKEEGYRVILVNSNPATIMTDPEFADRTYIEPLTVEVLTAIIAKEKPDAILPTLGGQTALNLALALDAKGVLAAYDVELLGARVEAIRKAEDRELFKQAMARIGLECPRAFTARSLEEANRAADKLGYPLILRPSFTMGGAGGGIAHSAAEFQTAIRWAFQQSPTHECLIEESVLGWKEYEVEVIRDRADNFGVICSIENLDPMGVHTGDSITVAPAMTLTDREYQALRDAARAVITEIGVDTGGSNIQFAIHPETGRQLVIEMNPRVSRSSALASKATGYPIAKVAAKLAVGYTLDELKNDITGTSAAFEPSIDYVVCKIPRFAFEKFAGADARLTTQMKSVGEAMGIGRSFAEALQKAALSLENGRTGLQSLADKVDYVALAALLEQVRRAGKPLSLTTPPRPAAGQAPLPLEQQKDALLSVLRTPLADRLWFVCDALRAGVAEAEVQAATSIDPWFVAEIAALMRLEARIRDAGTGDWSWLAEAKRQGFADRQLAALRGVGVQEVAAARKAAAVAPAFCQVDTCAAEFVAHTPYFYSTWGQENEAQRQPGEKVLILGGGPNRIGQGIEFDYCCVHACFALRELGIAPVMLNCNPETVSTDYDTSDRLYFEPLTLEHVLAVAAQEQVRGVIVQFGGQTPIRLAQALTAAGVKVLGTPADAIDRAEDRERFDALLQALGLRRPHGGIARGVQEARNVAASIGYPLVVRPSYVLGGRGMEVVHDEAELTHYFQVAFAAAQDEAETTTILLDEYVRGAIEVDVDALCDGEQVFIGGVMQHIEEAGVHSGDSALVLPAHALPPEVQGAIRAHTRALALKLGVVGLLNVQFAVRGNDIFVIEVNPRASRTVPFVSKAIGVPLAKVAAKLMLGQRLADLGLHREPTLPHVAVKESVLPFTKFPGVDTLLGPEMRSTGEVMGLGPSFPVAFHKAMLAAGTELPDQGTAFVSVKDSDKAAATEVARQLVAHGFRLVATRGTAKALARAGLHAATVHKVTDGERPHVVDVLREGGIHLVINTTQGAQAIRDSRSLRRQTLLSGVPYFTTMAAASAAVAALQARRTQPLHVQALQEAQGPAAA